MAIVKLDGHTIDSDKLEHIISMFDIEYLNKTEIEGDIEKLVFMATKHADDIDYRMNEHNMW